MTYQNKNGAGPSVLRFEARLFRHPQKAKAGSKALLNVPEWVGKQLFSRGIESARKPETRARRIRRAVEQLSSGDRRACCVNVYEFMLNRIREDEQAGES